MTSAGQILDVEPPPYFVLIEKALRDEGTSYHYLPPSLYSEANSFILDSLYPLLSSKPHKVLLGSTWTTDAPFHETAAAIQYAQSEGIFGS